MHVCPTVRLLQLLDQLVAPGGSVGRLALEHTAQHIQQQRCGAAQVSVMHMGWFVIENMVILKWNVARQCLWPEICVQS